MKKFSVDYDEENDSLFVYSADKRSGGAIESGNIVLDFDSAGSLVGMEFLDASDFFKTVFSKVIEMGNIREFRADVVNFRNMNSLVKFSITTDAGTERNSVIVPRVSTVSPAVDY